MAFIQSQPRFVVAGCAACPYKSVRPADARAGPHPSHANFHQRHRFRCCHRPVGGGVPSRLFAHPGVLHQFGRWAYRGSTAGNEKTIDF